MFKMSPSQEIDPELRRLLEKAAEHKLTSQELRLQRISWAYGNISLHDPNITREMVEQADKELHPYDYTEQAH